MAAGRPTAFREEFVEQVQKLARLGATDEEIADFFAVSVQTTHNWRKAHPEFLEALRAGKIEADAQVADKLFQRATGYRWTEQQAIKVKSDQFSEQIEIVDVEREVPPDTTACIFWLKNRRAAQWREKQDVNLAGADGGPLNIVIKQYAYPGE